MKLGQKAQMRKDSDENDQTQAVIKEHLIEEQKIKLFGEDDDD